MGSRFRPDPEFTQITGCTMSVAHLKKRAKQLTLSLYVSLHEFRFKFTIDLVMDSLDIFFEPMDVTSFFIIIISPRVDCLLEDYLR